LVSALLIHELVGLLVQNPRLFSDADLALYQAFVSAGEMATTCQVIDTSVSGGTLSAALLREGLLHVAWVGDSKAVLGRLAAKPPAPVAACGDGAAGPGPTPGIVGRPAVNLARPLERRPGSHVASIVSWPPAMPGFDAPEHGNEASSSGLPLPLLRAVEITADHVEPEAAITNATPREEVAPACVDPADGAGGPPLARPPGRLTRFFGNSLLREAVDGATGGRRSCMPEVRRLRLRREDIFVILGTGGLWKRLSPTEAVTIVGQNLHRSATNAADELVAEVERRRAPGRLAEDLTAVVLYLAGERYVQDRELQSAGHGPGGLQALQKARDQLAGCCIPDVPVQPRAPRVCGPA